MTKPPPHKWEGPKSKSQKASRKKPLPLMNNKKIDMGPADMYGKKSEDMFWPYSAGNFTND